MKVRIENTEFIFNLNDIVIKEKTIYPLNSDYDEIVIDGEFLFCYDMNVLDEASLDNYEIIKGTDEEIEKFNKILR